MSTVFAVRRHTVVLAATTFALLMLALPWTLQATHLWPGAALAPASKPVRHTLPRSDTQESPQHESPQHESPQFAALAAAAPPQGGSTRDSAGSPRVVGTGLAENAWDFNDPAGVPGFGPLDPADARRLLKLMDRSSGR